MEPASAYKKEINYRYSPDMDLYQASAGILDTYRQTGHNRLDKSQPLKRPDSDCLGFVPARPGMVAAPGPASHETWLFNCSRSCPVTSKDFSGQGIKTNFPELNSAENFFNNALVEKIVLVSLLSIIFAQVLPEVRSTNLQLAIGMAILIMINTALSHWLARHVEPTGNLLYRSL